MQTGKFSAFFIICIVLLSFQIAPMVAQAEDVIVTKNRTFRGKIESADLNNITIEVLQHGRQDKLTIPRAIIVNLIVQPPPSVVKGIEAYEKGDMKRAKLNLGSVMMKYQGLDADWAQKGMVFFGRASLINSDYENAEKAFESFLKAYPDHPLSVAAKIGLADVELSKKNYVTALEQFRRLAEPYKNQLKPPRDQWFNAAEIYMGIGKCLDEQDDLAGALDAYMRVIALYPVEIFYPEALYRSALIYMGTNKFARAEMLLSELIDKYGATDFARKAIEKKKEIHAR